MYVSPFLKMTLEEQMGDSEAQQQEPPPENEEYEEGEGLPIADPPEESSTSQTVEAQVEMDITEESESDKMEPKESDPLKGGACADAPSPSKVTFNNQHSKMSIEELEQGEEEGIEKRKSFDPKCAILGGLLLLVIVLGAIGGVFINKFSAKKSYTFEFGKYFNDHMVLQRAPHRAVVYGSGPVSDDKNLTVVLTIEGKDISREYSSKIEATVSGGLWRVTLDPMLPPGPFIIRAKLHGENVESIQLKDVLFGDVWLCAGQRNMQFSVEMLAEEEKEEALENLEEYSQIRLMAAWPFKNFITPGDMYNPLLRWSVPSEKSLLGNTDVPHQYASHFSALCWQYGKRLHKKLKYPIGLVTATYYYSSIEDWIPPEVITECKIDVPHETSTVYNAMIKPLLPTTIYGVIWYQGELEAELPETDLDKSTRKYDCSLVHMMNTWRQQWFSETNGSTDPDFPFGIVQLSAYRNGSNQTHGYTDIRWQQTSNYGFVPNVWMTNSFMAVTVDLPDEENSVMPKYKATIAERLVKGALAVAYDQKNTVYQGPFPQKYAAFRNNQSLVLYLDTEELEKRNHDGFEVCCANNTGEICVISFMKAIFAPGREWVPATISRQDGNSVTLKYDGHHACDSNKHVVAIRYLWQETPCEYLKCPLYDSQSGLPMAPYVKQGLIDDGKYHDLGREPTNHTFV